jgi:hypothetical protein
MLNMSLKEAVRQNQIQVSSCLVLRKAVREAQMLQLSLWILWETDPRDRDRA